MSLYKGIVFFGAGILALSAQDGSLSGPVAGLVFDRESRALRPMIGVPGSSHLGAGLADGMEMAAVSPSGRLILASTEGRMLLGRIDEAGLKWSALGPEPAPELIVWSRSSATAASYNADSRRLVLWKNLDGQPEAIALPLPEQGELTALVVESSGDGVVASVDAAVYRFDAAGASVLARLERPGALLLGAGERDLFVVDRGRQEILTVRGYRETPDVARLAGQGLGIADPVALALSPDGGSLLIAQARSLVVWDLTAADIRLQMGLDFEPTRLEPLVDGSVYALNARLRAGDVLRVLEFGDQPAIYFVPAGEATPSSVQE